MKKTVIKIGEVTIESDGSVDIEIDGNVVRVKGSPAPPTFTVGPIEYQPSIPGYPWKYSPHTTPWNPDTTAKPIGDPITWRTTCTGMSTPCNVPISGSWYVMTEEMKKNSSPTA